MVNPDAASARAAKISANAVKAVAEMMGEMRI
jgi:hypothetical protein